MTPRRRIAFLRAMKQGAWVNGLLIVSVGVAVCRGLFAHKEELFPGGAYVGDILLGVALAYVGAWIFNLLVVEVPRQRDLEMAMTIGAPFMRRLGHAPRELYVKMTVYCGAPLANPSAPNWAEPTVDEIRQVFQKIKPTDRSRSGPLQHQWNPIAPQTWIEEIQAAHSTVSNSIAQPNPIYHMFDVQLVQACLGVGNHSFWKWIELPTGLGALNNLDELTPLAEQFQDLLGTSAKLLQTI